VNSKCLECQKEIDLSGCKFEMKDSEPVINNGKIIAVYTANGVICRKCYKHLLLVNIYKAIDMFTHYKTLWSNGSAKAMENSIANIVNNAMNYYRLEGKKVIKVNSAIEFTHDKIKQEYVYRYWFFGKVFVSTIFLGIDHNFGGGKPLVFETMIFGGKHDLYQERYSTYEEAIEGHKRAVLLAKGKIKGE